MLLAAPSSHRLVALAAAALLIVLAVGCGDNGPAFNGDTAAPDASTDNGTAPDTSPADTASGDAGSTGGGDANASPSDTEQSDAETSGPALEPYFALGTNIAGEATPDSFTELNPGDDLAVVYGAQGLWMVVLAFRTRDMFEGRLTLIARIGTAEQDLGQFGIAKQDLIDGADGFDYYYNFFLVVDDATIEGETGFIEFSLEDDVGFEHVADLEVTLVGGYHPEDDR